MKRILVGIKNTPGGRYTFSKALELARQCGAWLHVFHALDYHLLRKDTPEEKIEQLTLETQRQFENELRPLLEGYSRFGFNCWEDEPATGICRLAGETGADLVIIGCHEHPRGTRLSRVGMVASRILESAPCPVMLVPCIQPEAEASEGFFSSPCVE